MSRNQLLLLSILLKDEKKAWGVTEIEKTYPLKTCALGGVLSSLSRTNFRGQYLILPYGRDEAGGVGLRWKVNNKAMNASKARKEVDELLSSF